MSKGLKITLITLASIVVIIGIFLLIWFIGDKYPTFYEKTKKEFTIEGLDEGFTPQGLTYDKNTNTFLTAGYMKDSSKPSRIYWVEGSTQITRKYCTLKDGDKEFTAHAGGIATDGISVWICGEEAIVEVEFSKIQAAKNGDAVQIKKNIPLKHSSAYAFVENNYLWIGEFENGKKYKLPESHFVKTSNGKTNTALAFCYNINHEKEGGFDSTKPVKILSTPRLVQGMAIEGNKVIISTSYSLPNSHIYIYNNVFTQTPKTIKFDGNDIELFVLEDKDLSYDLETPSMSEEIVIANNRVYIIYENACKKYSFATREKLKNVYSFDINIK